MEKKINVASTVYPSEKLSFNEWSMLFNVSSRYATPISNTTQPFDTKKFVKNINDKTKLLTS